MEQRNGDTWRSLYMAIGADRNFLTGVSESTSITSQENQIDTEVKKFYADFYDYIIKRVNNRLTALQKEILFYYIDGRISQKNIAAIKNCSNQNIWKRLLDIVSLIQRTIFYDKRVKKFIKEFAPESVKLGLLSWFEDYHDSYFEKYCPVCKHVMVSNQSFLNHFAKMEATPLENSNRGSNKTKEKHQVFLSEQYARVKKFLEEGYTEERLDHLMMKSFFKMNRAWVILKFGQPNQDKLI